MQYAVLQQAPLGTATFRLIGFQAWNEYILRVPLPSVLKCIVDQAAPVADAGPSGPDKDMDISRTARQSEPVWYADVSPDV